MKKKRITERLGISFPILQGGMLWLADAGLVAAVSNAGALGVIRPMAGMKPHGDMKKGGATPEEISNFLGYAPSRRAGLEGNIDSGEAYCGSSAGLVNEIVDAATVIRSLVEDDAGVIETL